VVSEMGFLAMLQYGQQNRVRNQAQKLVHLNRAKCENYSPETIHLQVSPELVRAQRSSIQLQSHNARNLLFLPIRNSMP
jgi:hypothetical protein